MKSVGERANGKPGPLRPCSSLPLGDRKSSFQSQTGSQALSDTIPPATVQRWEDQFQSQTGSQALSDVVRQIRILLAVIRFQSQTGSQALSDFAQVAILVIGSRFNPKREAR